MKRNTVLDILKGIGILLVIFGHTISGNNLGSIIYCFHMPLFFFLSGVALYYLLKKNYTFKSFLQKKFKSIIVPYFVFSIISIIYWILIERKIRGQMNISIMYNFFNIFVAKADPNLYAYNIAMWFLPCLFVSEFIFFMIMKLKNKFLKIFIVIVSFFIGYCLSINKFLLPFGLEISLIGLFFIYAGYISTKNILKSKSSNKINILKFILFIFSFFSLILCYKLDNNVNMLNHSYSGFLLFLIGASVEYIFVTLLHFF